MENIRIKFKLPKIWSFLIFFWFFLFSPIFVFGQQRAADLVKKIDEQLETGKVLKVMKWDAKTQTMIIFDPLFDSENSPKNFLLEVGASYFVLTDVRGIEFIDLPFETAPPQIRDGWNLAPWKSDLIEKYDIKQITCFNSEFQQYEDIIFGFNDEILPTEGQGCWLYVGQGKETEGTPHAIYGKISLDGNGTKATISVINLTNGKHGITETDENGKFVYDLLNLGWERNDKILISANSNGVEKEIFLEIDPKVPNQRVDVVLPKKLPSERAFWQLITAIILIIFVISFFGFKKIKKLKEKK